MIQIMIIIIMWQGCGIIRNQMQVMEKKRHSRSMEDINFENGADHFHSPEPENEDFTHSHRVRGAAHAILDPRLSASVLSRRPKLSSPDIRRHPRSQTLPQEEETDHGNVPRLYTSALEGRQGRWGEEQGGAGRPGVAAECGLCLDEFQDCGDKIPRNLHCGHTFCTGELYAISCT